MDHVQLSSPRAQGIHVLSCTTYMYLKQSVNDLLGGGFEPLIVVMNADTVENPGNDG